MSKKQKPYNFYVSMAQSSDNEYMRNLCKILVLKCNINLKVDIATTKRFLINLGSFKNRKKAILKIYDCLNGNGYHLMLECCINGLNNMNIVRQNMD